MISLAGLTDYQIFGMKKAAGLNSGRATRNGIEYHFAVAYWEDLIRAGYATKMNRANGRVVYRLTLEALNLITPETVDLKRFKQLCAEFMPVR